MTAKNSEPVAIIGLHCKLPEDADSLQGFWKMLCEARNVATEPPEGRYNMDAFYHPDPARLDAIRTRKAHYLKEDPRSFDAPFFSMSVAEASVVDPMQRCLLEGAYQTFENAGIPMDRVAGSKTSVYCANFARDQETMVARDPEYQSRYQSTATGYALLSNRISHFYDLRGPSLTLDTACSSGLYALHLAVQSIALGESEMSLVCGANTCMTPEAIAVVLDNASFLSKDGRCFSFDRRANGYGRGEGFAFVLLKPLSKAMRDGDCIRAVVRGTGANQDGRTPSISQPSAEAQRALIRDTYERAGLGLDQTGLFEAHGTGTLVGDPIETEAIGEIFQAHRNSNSDKNSNRDNKEKPPQPPPLYIGSVKSNIGHLEGASGLAGLIKAVLALEKAIIPPNADFEANPSLRLDELNLKVPTKAVPWPMDGLRRASVSSFGYGGSNAHAVLDDAYNYLKSRGMEEEAHHQSVEKYREEELEGGYNATGCYGSSSSSSSDGSSNNNSHHPPGAWALIPFSAQDEEGTKRQAEALQSHLATVVGLGTTNGGGIDEKHFLLNLTHTLAARRSILNWRSAAVVSSLDDACTNLQSLTSKAIFTLASKTPILSFVFTGQGAQYARMAWGLLERYHIFEAAMAECDRFLTQELACPWSVREELERDAKTSRINQPLYSQPLSTAVQVALVDLLTSWGLVPSSVIGHSSGEIAAAYAAGAISRESAWRIAYYRGVVCERLVMMTSLAASDASSSSSLAPSTTMMSVGLGESDVAMYLEGSMGVTVACVNSPCNVTVSGPIEAIDKLYQRLDAAKIFAKYLPVKIGYHSAVMSQGSEEYEAMLTGGIRAPPSAPPSALQAPPPPPVPTAPPAPPAPVVRGRAAMFSSVTGEAIDLHELTKPSYWVSNLVLTVKFAQALTAMTSQSETKTGNRFFLELGPQASLRRPIQDTLAAATRTTTTATTAAAAAVAAPKRNLKWRYAPVLSPTGHDVQGLLEAVGQLWSDGVNVDLDKVNESSIITTTTITNTTMTTTRSPAPAAPAPKLMVDLPSYPFSRAKWYWDESRISKSYAFRPFRRHALLGIRDKDWNGNEGAWRHSISVDENPWIRDHALNGSAIYPGSGMLVMAIEAVRQLADAHKDRIKGYRLSSVRMLRPIQVDGSSLASSSKNGAEAKIHLRPRKLYVPSEQLPCYDFRIYTIQAEEWTEVAFGSIKVELEPEAGAAEEGYEPSEREREKAQEEKEKEQQQQQESAASACDAKFTAEHRQEYEDIAKRCSLVAHTKQFYSNLSRKSGFDYGPYFQLLQNISYDRSGHVTATVNLRDYAQHMQYAHEDPCVVHPTTLDALCQSQMVGLSRGGWYTIPTMMFTHVEELWVSHKLFTIPGNPRLKVASQETRRGFRGCVCRTIALLEDTMEPVIVCDGQGGTAISSLSTAITTDTEATGRMAYTINYEPHVPLLRHLKELRPVLQQGATQRNESLEMEMDRTNRSDAIMLHYAKQVVASIDAGDDADAHKHHQTSKKTKTIKNKLWEQEGHYFGRYVDFLRHLVADEAKWSPEGRVAPLLAGISMQQILQDAELDPGCALNKHVGEHVLAILEGKTSPLEVIFAGDRVDAFYHADLTSLLNRVIGDYARILSHNDPNLRFLELGAGTGSSTARILPGLMHDLGNGQQAVRCREYMYTDVSSGFFERARERFSHAYPALKFAKLDIEADPTVQGFQEGSYDVVVAGNVLHVTKDLVQTLKNVRKLLKPGGSLCLAELVNVETPRHAFVFGLLPGWWLRPPPPPLGEAAAAQQEQGYTDQGPLLSASQWDQAFREAGFSGVQLEFQDFEDPLYRQVSILITTNPTVTPEAPEATVVTSSITSSSSSISSIISSSIRSSSSSSSSSSSGLGLDVVDPGGDDHDHNPNHNHHQYMVVVDPASDLQMNLCKEIQARLGPSCSTQSYSLSDMTKLSDSELEESIVISLVELDSAVLAAAAAAAATTITGVEFDGIKRLGTRAKMTIWLTTGLGPAGQNPDGEVTVGFARSLCSERADQCFVILSLENPWGQQQASGQAASVETLLRVLTDARQSDSASRETEYYQFNGLLYTPRLIPAGHINKAMLARNTKRDMETYTYFPNTDTNTNSNTNTNTNNTNNTNMSHVPKPRFHLTIETPGLLETLYYTEDAAGADDLPAPGSCEIEIKVAGLQFRDVMVALGQVTDDSFGCDGAGVVTRAGPNSIYKPGDRVIYCSNDAKGFGTFARYRDQDLTLMPPAMSFQVGAAISAVWRTAVYSLDHLARLRSGQSVLIHAGAGGVGQAAIQLAQLRGASPIYVTVSNSEKRELVKSLYGIPDHHIFHSRTAAFKANILRATGGKGVDVILNSVSGELLQATWQCIAPLGTFIDIGKGDAMQNNQLEMGPFSRNVTFACVDLSLISTVNPQLMTDVMTEVLLLFHQHPQLHAPLPLQVYAPDKIEDAFRSMQSGKSTGKILVDYEAPPAAGATVRYQPAIKPSYRFPAQATYLIAGGLGGLGREITRWMVHRGARHFLLLNSRGVDKKQPQPNPPEAAVVSFLEELDSLSVKHLEPPCDCADYDALESVLQAAAAAGFPPVRGCIQGAMRLDDDAITNMPLAKLHAALNPKRVATWNLHKLLSPQHLDFFVLLSSFCGVFGNPGQANYAAGGSFQDAFARYRTSLGQNTVTIDLAMVAEAGWANDNYEMVASNLRTYGGIHNDQLMALLDVVCDPTYYYYYHDGNNNRNKNNNAQIVTIVDRPQDIYTLTQEGRIVWPTKPLFRHLLRIGEINHHGSGNGNNTESEGQNQNHTNNPNLQNGSEAVTSNYVALVKAAASLDEAGDILAAGLVQKLSKSLSVDPQSLDTARPAYVLGVDSLIAVELRYWFMRTCGIEVPVFVIMKNQPLTTLCVHAASKILDAVI